MKIRPDHYQIISAALDTVSDKVNEAIPKYKEQGLSDKRLRWDALSLARIEGNSSRWICDNLYSYLNDDHIDSALRHYFKHKI